MIEDGMRPAQILRTALVSADRDTFDKKAGYFSDMVDGFNQLSPAARMGIGGALGGAAIGAGTGLFSRKPRAGRNALIGALLGGGLGTLGGHYFGGGQGDSTPIPTDNPYAELLGGGNLSDNVPDLGEYYGPSGSNPLWGILNEGAPEGSVDPMNLPSYDNPLWAGF